MTPTTSNGGTLNPKQLVFFFMAATVVSVVVFLCGVLVGRGVSLRPGSDVKSRDGAVFSRHLVGLAISLAFGFVTDYYDIAEADVLLVSVDDDTVGRSHDRGPSAPSDIDAQMTRRHASEGVVALAERGGLVGPLAQNWRDAGYDSQAVAV